MKIFIKNNLLNFEGDNQNLILSSGQYELYTLENDTIASLINTTSGKLIFWRVPITSLEKENGTPYANKAELLSELGSFFFSTADSYWETYTTKSVFVPGAPTTGTLTYIDDLNFSVAGATYTENEFAGKVVEIKKNGQTQYSIIASNTADIITLSQPLISLAETGDVFNILDTHYIGNSKTDFPQIYGLYPTQNTGALVVPEVIEDKERLIIDLYIESISDNNEIIIIAQGEQGFFSDQFRWIKLVDDKESFRLVGHFFTPSLHWDIINTGNLKRYITAYYNEFILANNTNPQYIPAANYNLDKRRRFECRNIDGVQWCEFTSLIPKFFLAVFTAEIQKSSSGGAGEVKIKWNKYDSETETIQILDYEAVTRFGNQDGTQTITLSQPVELQYGDRLAVTVQREAGTITLKEFSNIYVKEF